MKNTFDTVASVSCRVLVAAALLAPLTRADGNLIKIGYSKLQYEPNEQVVLQVSGAPGTLSLLLFDLDGGPTSVPGIGVLDVGLSDKLTIVPLPPIPDTGMLQLTTSFDCTSRILGSKVFTQGLSLDVPNLKLCPSNSAVLLVTDTTGQCDPCQGMIGDFVFLDMNQNGLQDMNELGIGGVALMLTDSMGNTFTTTTDSTGLYLFTDLCPDTYVVSLDPSTVPSALAPTLCDIGNDDALDSDCTPVTVMLKTKLSFDLTNDFGFANCAPCKGKVTALTLRYNGAMAALVEVPKAAFSKTVQPGQTFNLFSKDSDFGTSIDVFVNGQKNTNIHTSCSQPIGPGLVKGDFLILAGKSKDGGVLCNQGNDVCADGKPQMLTMLYTGQDCSASMNMQPPDKFSCSGDPMMTSPAKIVAFKDSKIFFSGLVELGQTFVIDATAAGNSHFDADTFVNVFDASGATLLQAIKFHTSCSQPLFVGNQFGSLKLVAFVPEP